MLDSFETRLRFLRDRVVTADRSRLVEPVCRPTSVWPVWGIGRHGRAAVRIRVSPVNEARIVELREAHRTWGCTGSQSARQGRDRFGAGPVQHLSGAGRAWAGRGGATQAAPPDCRRWERGRPGSWMWWTAFHLIDGTELEAVSDIDDNYRFVVSAMLVRRATTRPVCEALLAALRRHGCPDQILTENGQSVHWSVRAGRLQLGGDVRPGVTGGSALSARIRARGGARKNSRGPDLPCGHGHGQVAR